MLDQIEMIPDSDETKILIQLKKHYMKKFTVEEHIKAFKCVENYTQKVKVLLGLIASNINNEYFRVILKEYYEKIKKPNKIKINIDLEKLKIRNEWSVLIETR